MKKIIFGFILGFVLTLGISVNADNANETSVPPSAIQYWQGTNEGYMKFEIPNSMHFDFIGGWATFNFPVEVNGNIYSNGEQVVTQNYLKENYINKTEVQKMINEALVKATTH